ncbi:N-acetyl-alpha-D-glucosaminyl L-malate synthase [Fundidesulfovibrio magnetotacticus]|uniref:N-acetyl-alpha-D-glucosaminyl L-malate synthase n=1 Tax=Fundidesulfovibrio magnetotacticus TaxID=2730080 RepID=A0A6V8LUI3_9BACT|nr:glycosyltransferase [Fundidesulfovibrio magnetotacticus]GFK96122.1 N-acetyl-alpha-D-glucosaminyl L-malate synthase [Fundidesulfovibrio magnetotacticus]
MADRPGVHHHAVLRRRGGAARVARTLAARLEPERRAGLSCEIDEPDDPQSGDSPTHVTLVAPEDLAGHAPDGVLVHAHATRDWPGLLSGFAGAGRPLALTLHDCSPFTGGCIAPLECPHFQEDCRDPCPRGYPGSAAARAMRREAALAARPVVAAPSRWMARLARAAWPGLGVTVIPNGVEIPAESADKTRARARLGIDPGARVALFLAHGGQRAGCKGGGRFEAIRLALRQRAPQALAGRLLVLTAGGDEARRSEGELVLPYVEGEWLEALYAASDVLAYPTLADNHPLVVLEAMAHGLPVVSYAVGGIPEQLPEGEGGLLVSPGDEACLVGRVLDVLGREPLRRDLAARGRERALRHFDAARMASDYERLYAAAFRRA